MQDTADRCSSYLRGGGEITGRGRGHTVRTSSPSICVCTGLIRKLWFSTKQKLNDDDDIGSNIIAEAAAIDYRLHTCDGWTCAYWYKAAQPYEDQQRYTPLLLMDAPMQLTWAEQCLTLIQKDIQRPCTEVCQGVVSSCGSHSYPFLSTAHFSFDTNITTRI
jgi:hypothetical protein